MDKTQKRIIKSIDNNKKYIIELTNDLVRTNSVNPPGNEFASAQIIKWLFERMDFKPKLIAKDSRRPNLYCSAGRGEKSLLFNCCLDTAPVFDEKKWKTNPFNPKIIQGRLYGRGALDCKSGVSAMVFAFKTLSDVLTDKLIFVGSINSKGKADKKIGLNYVLERMKKKPDAAIITEPFVNKICIGNKGLLWIKIFEEKKDNDNPNLKLLKKIKEIQEINFNSKELYDEKTTVDLNIINGGFMESAVPSYSEAVFNIRFLPGTKPETIINKIKKVTKNYEIVQSIPPAVTPEKTGIVKAMQSSINELMNKKTPFGISSMNHDISYLINNKIPAVGFGPEGGGINSDNEYVIIESIINACKVYALTAYKYFIK